MSNFDIIKENKDKTPEEIFNLLKKNKNEQSGEYVAATLHAIKQIKSHLNQKGEM